MSNRLDGNQQRSQDGVVSRPIVIVRIRTLDDQLPFRKSSSLPDRAFVAGSDRDEGRQRRIVHTLSQDGLIGFCLKKPHALPADDLDRSLEVPSRYLLKTSIPASKDVGKIFEVVQLSRNDSS